MKLISRPFVHRHVSLDVHVAPDVDSLITCDTDPDRLPLWAVLWDSAPALSRHLIGRGALEGVPVLELGCGAGLVGMTAARLGARVLQTDRFPEAAALAQENARRNCLLHLRQVAADWRWWPLRSQWPLIIASDVVYERSMHPALLQVLDQALSPNGEALLSDPMRVMSEAFVLEAEGKGWSVERSEAPRQPGEPPIWICRLTRW